MIGGGKEGLWQLAEKLLEEYSDIMHAGCLQGLASIDLSLQTYGTVNATSAHGLQTPSTDGKSKDRGWHRHRCPWSTMECSQPAAWTTNKSLLVASNAKAFPGRPTNSGSTLPRAAHLNSDVIGRHQCITLHSESAPASPVMRPTPRLCPAFLPSTTSIPAPTNPP